MKPSDQRQERIARVVCGVLRQVVADGRAEGVVLSATAAHECALAREWCERALGPDRVPGDGAGRLLRAHAATKTTLLLCPIVPVAVLPLGDLYGSELLEMGADWNPPPLVCELAELAGGAELLDRALRQWTEERRTLEASCQGLPPAARVRLTGALADNRVARRSIGLVPKLTSRTLGIDLWE